MQIHLPIEFGIERKRQIDASDFPCKRRIEEFRIRFVGSLLSLFERRSDTFGFVFRKGFDRPTLFVILTLRCDVFIGGNVELVFHDRITAGHFVHPTRAVAYPLTRDEDRHFKVKSHHNLFEGRSVFVAQKIIDERAVLRNRLRSFSVRNARCLNDPRVSAEIIDKADKPLVEHGIFFIENRFRFGNNTVSHTLPL